MESFERINQRMSELGISQADLIRGTGAGRATVSGWVNGSNSPSAKFIEPLARTLKTTSQWILTGTGLKDLDAVSVEPWDSSTPVDDDEVEIKFLKDLRMACGSGNIGVALESETRKLRMSKSTLRKLCIEKDNAIATTADGDSMSPTIKDGDTIHIDLGRTEIKDGRIYAICHGGLYKVKRLYNLPMGGVRVVSDNSVEFPEEKLTAQEVVEQEFTIVGWVWQIATLERW